MKEPLITARNVKKYFPIVRGILRRTAGYVRAVDGVDFDINKGETLGLVGESGCGKTTLGRLLLRLIKVTDGTINFEGEDITKTKKLEKIRHKMQIIFQDPDSCLNPRLTVKSTITEGLSRSGIRRSERKEKVFQLLKEVGMDEIHASRYPHQLSGGQRQRVGIARALAVNPEFIVADEPVSALDVSVRAQILNLMFDLQKKFDLTYLFIAHDLSVVKYVSDRVAVMYVGKFMELAPVAEIFMSPLHPYTEALLSAVPDPDPDLKRTRIILKGDVASPINPPPGCRFHTRCRIAIQKCKEVEPELRMLGEGHYVACHLAK